MLWAASLETGLDNAALEKRRRNVACLTRINSGGESHAYHAGHMQRPVTSLNSHFLPVHSETGATYQEGSEP